MSKHTPGPWFYDLGATEALIVEEDGATVAEIRTTYQTTAHRSLEANARLMAAAPDLLAALTDLYLVAKEQLDQTATHDGLNNWQWLARARAAIRKATGEA